jgi:hypothetical protein
MPYEIVKEGISFGLEENSKNWGEHAIKIRDRLHRAHHVARKHLAINWILGACSGFSYFKKFT